MSEQRLSKLIGTVGGAVLVVAILLDYLGGRFEAPIHVLLIIGLGLIAYSSAWLGGFGALLLPLSVRGDDLSNASIVGLSVETGVVAVLAIVARAHVVRSRTSELKLRALMSSMDDVILILDQDGTYLEIVPTNPSLLYRPPDSLLGKRIEEVFPSEQAQWFVQQIRRALNEGPISVDYPMEIGENHFWFAARVSPLTESTVLWVARDISARKEAESRLVSKTATAEELYRSVIEQAEEIIFTLSTEGIINSLNPSFERILGWPCQQWIGKSFIGLVPAEAHSYAETLFAQLQRDEGLPTTRMTIVARNGSLRRLEFSLVRQVLHEENVGFVGVARDITEREAAEAMLRRSERQLSEAQKVAKIGSWEHDLITNTVWSSEETYRIFGLPPADVPMTLEEFLRLIPEHDRPRIDDVQAKLMLNREYEWELHPSLSDGSQKVLRCRGRVMSDARGGVVSIVGTVQDVTEQRRADELLRESEERFRLVARATTDAIYDLDLPAGSVWRGERYETLFGYAHGELKPTVEAWRELVHPDDVQRVIDAWKECLETGQMDFSADYRFRRRDGTYVTIHDRASIVRDSQGRPVRMVGAMVDVTERRQLEEQLEQAKRVSSLGRVAASIAHEFNNVLMGIQPNVEVIQRRSPSGLQKITDNITRAVQRGKRITDEILRFTRPAEPALQCVQVSKFLARWSDEIRPLLGTTEIKFETDDDVYVEADPAQLAQVLTNLSLNARDAMMSEGTITVAAHLSKSFGAFPFGVLKTPDRFVHFTVHDHGCGITPDRLEHIFEPLFTTKRGGVGLGLAITYQVVTRHEGHIFVESEVGKGSTFHIFIPATVPLLHEVQPERSVGSFPIRRLLLVEDEPAVASGITMLFEMEGVTVETATTGAEAVPAIERSSPDAVILDIGLPDIDGVTVYRQIESRWPALPVLFSSGHGDAAKLEKDLARPNVGFILKPYDFDAVRAALSTLLDNSVSAAC